MVRTFPGRKNQRYQGFTLIELLVVIAIIAILAVVVVLTLNPAQMLAQSRDANRVSDMATINSALSLYQVDQSNASGYSMGSASTTYPSVYDPAATSTAGTNCSTMGLPQMPANWNWHCAASSTYRNASTTGWIPVNFQNVSAGSPFGTLPVDPTNNTSSRLFYTYSTNGSQYEVTAAMESSKYQLGGQNDQISSDGANLATVYAKGTNTSLEPLDYGDASLVGYWPLNEGSGGIAYDDSGNNATGSWMGTKVGTNSTYYTSGNNQPYAGDFDGSTDYISGSFNAFTGDFTSMVWVYITSGVNNEPLSLYVGGGFPAIRLYRPTNMSIQCYQNPSGGDSVTSPNNIVSFNTWEDIACSYSQNTGIEYLYVNGQLVATSTPASSPANTSGSQNMRIGYDSFSGATHFAGVAYDVRIYDRTLSAAAIQALYNSGK